MKYLKIVLAGILALALVYLETSSFERSGLWSGLPTQKIVAKTEIPLIILSAIYTILAVWFAGRLRSIIKTPDPLPETRTKKINIVVNAVAWPLIWYRIFIRPSLLVGLPLYLVVPKVACFVLISLIALLNGGIVVYRIINRRPENLT